MKPNLYCFGDSYIIWERPELHWTLRFEDEYNVHRYGKPGSSNLEIILQTRYLPKFNRRIHTNDRVLFVLTDTSRLPKYFWGEHYREFSFSQQTGEDTDNEYIKSMVELQCHLTSMIDKRVYYRREDCTRYESSPYEFYVWLKYLNSLLGHYRPVYLTWSKNTYETCKPLIDISYIAPEEYTTVTDETGYLIGGTHYDSHPGEQGGKIWYETAKKLLL